MSNNDMDQYVVKRNGRKQPVKLEKVLNRIEQQCTISSKIDTNYVKPLEVAKKVIDGIYNGVTTSELDKLAVETAATLATQHPDYDKLAARLAVSSLHKETKKYFSDVTEDLFRYINVETNEPAPLVSEDYYNTVMANKDVLDGMISYNRDYDYDYIGLKTLEKSYLLKIDKKIAERPQHLIMRCAIGIHGSDIEEVGNTYEMMSHRLFTHATPTLFNAGMPRPQLASCFLLEGEDSIEGIFDSLKECAQISKNAGGIGLAVSDIRASGSYITGTNGSSNGLIPFLKIFNETARAVDQGGGKRKGSMAIYIEPWHADIMDFLDLRKNHGKEEMRARDLFYAMWMNDLFMQRVQKNEMWSLMCPNECRGLTDAYAEDFTRLYTEYESKGKFRKQLKARDVWSAICTAQMETGTPYMLYKDSINVKSNQKNIGTIKSSNLCAEIVEVTAHESEIAVCNLASIALPKFIKGIKNPKFDHKKLFDVAYQVTKNLNRVIDRTYYPVDKAKMSNNRHRPIGLGVQGLADVFFLFGVPYGSDESKKLNREIAETVYFASMSASCDLAEKEGAYETFEGSPLSKGIFQFDMWETEPTDRWDWKELMVRIKTHGVRNSLVNAQMPTGSTSSILGNEASTEAQTSNMYTRRVLAGEFICINKHLVKELCVLGIWNSSIRNKIIANDGSVMGIDEIPVSIQNVYKTTYEISQKDIIDIHRERSPFVDQTQSMNIWMTKPNLSKLTSMHFYGWGNGVTKDISIEITITRLNDEKIDLLKEICECSDVRKAEIELRIVDIEKEILSVDKWKVYGSTPSKALKTGSYYLRSQAASSAQKFTLVKDDTKELSLAEMIEQSKNSEDDEDCLMCSG